MRRHIISYYLGFYTNHLLEYQKPTPIGGYKSLARPLKAVSRAPVQPAMSKVHSLKVGVDFGTTYSGVAWVGTLPRFEGGDAKIMGL